MSYFRPPHPHSWPARATTQLPPDTRNPNAQTRWQANIPAGLPDSRLWPEPAECYRIDKSWTQFWLVKTGQMRESFIGWITLKFPMRGDKQSPTLWLIVLCSRPRITRTTTVCPSIQRSSAAFPSRTTYRYPTGSGPNTPGSSSSSTTTSWKDTRLPETSWKRWRTRPSKKCWIFNANSESRRRTSRLREDQAWLRTTSPPLPFRETNPNPTLTQTLDLTQGRIGTWSATVQGPFQPCGHASQQLLAKWHLHGQFWWSFHVFTLEL